MAVTVETQSGGDDPSNQTHFKVWPTPCTPVSSDNTNFLNTNQILQVTFSWCTVPGGEKQADVRCAISPTPRICTC